MRAAPRKPIRPAIVTTSDGSPIRATNSPWSRPAPAPASSATTTATANGTEPPSCRAATTAAENPITEATERSISPLMMTRVMTTATIAFSIDSWNMFTKFPVRR